MKKTPIIAAVVGLGIIGGGYLGGMYYLSGKTMSFLHAQADRLNAGQSVHVEIQNEQRGLFTSHATVNVTAPDNVVYIAPLNIHHGFFTTDVDSPSLVITENGDNVLKAAGAESDKATVTAHINNNGVRNQDLKGSTIDLVLPGKLGGSDGDGSTQLLNPTLRLERSSDGQLKISAHSDKVSVAEASGDTSQVEALSAALTYDTVWSDTLIQAARTYMQEKNEQTTKALQSALLAHLPDIHIDLKALKANHAAMLLGPKQVAADSFTLDVIRDQKAAVTRLTSDMKGIHSDDVKGNASLKLALDQPVVDTLLKLDLDESQAQIEQKIVALAQTSPRLVLEDLRLSTDQNAPISATGEAHIEGKSMHSINDIDPAIVVANVTINGLPAKAAEQLGINNIKPDQPIVVKLLKGHVTVNDQPMF